MFREFRDGTGTKTDGLAPISTCTSPPPTHPSTYLTAIATSPNIQDTSTSLPYQLLTHPFLQEHIHLLYHKLKECRAYTEGCCFATACSQCRCTWNTVCPLPCGIYGTQEKKIHYFQQSMLWFTSQLTSSIQLRTLVVDFSPPFSTVHPSYNMLTGEAFKLQLQQRLHWIANVVHTQSHNCIAECSCTHVIVPMSTLYYVTQLTCVHGQYWTWGVEMRAQLK